MPKQTFHLTGLEPDNLLAFFALLGTMRALEQAGIRVRASWQETPLRPVLSMPEPMTEEALLAAVNAGATALAEAHVFEDSDISFTYEKAQELLVDRCHPGLVSQLWSALISDGARKESGDVSATPLCAMFGQGHQHFLSRLSSIPRGDLTTELKKAKKPPNLNDVSYLRAALLEPWVRCDPTESFRWDPMEDRRYALRFENPSTDKGMTVHGANRLAAVGFPLLTCVPQWQPGGIRLTPRGGHWPRRRFVFRWPLWCQPATLTAVVALLGHAGLADETEPLPGVQTVMECERISVGKFFNFTRAVPWRQQA